MTVWMEDDMEKDGSKFATILRGTLVPFIWRWCQTERYPRLLFGPVVFWYLYVLMFVLTFVPCVIVLLFICQLAFMYESVHEYTSCSRVVWTPSLPLKYYRVIQQFCYFSSYSIDVITWHSPTQTKLLDFPFKSGNANDTLAISFKKHAYLSVCKSLEKVFLYKIIHPIFLSSHIYYPSPSICEVVKFDCKMKKLPWERVFCREKECFAVRKSVLPWERKFCRDTCGPPYWRVSDEKSFSVCLKNVPAFSSYSEVYISFFFILFLSL